MRFPRFHYGVAIALGLPMLCMSAVPVFADGLLPPTVSSSVDGSTINLSWDVPVGADHFIVRRSTTSAPSNTSEGTLILTTADTSITSYADTDLENGTYYYSVFADDGFGFASGPGTAGPLTVNVHTGGAAAHNRIRKRYAEIAEGLHGSAPEERNDTDAPSLSDVGIFIAGTGSTVKAENPAEEDEEIKEELSRKTQMITNLLQQQNESDSDPETVQEEVSPLSSFEQRVCARVWKRFSGQSLDRVNERLEKRLGFTCNT